MNYLFGPVHSRRLGVSLGIDLLPYKTCSLDCVYCECGKTTELSTERKEFFPTDDVISELDSYLSSKPDLDYITFSGSGEPTLHSGIGKIINHIKENYPAYRIAVLTNGTMLQDETVRKNILAADLVVPSLDAATDSSFFKICKPADGVTVCSVVDGLKAFRREYSGIMIIEIFIIPGINDTSAELAALRDVCILIAPDAIQLNTLDRPGCVDWITVPSPARLAEIKDYLKPLSVQLVGKRSFEEREPLESIEPAMDIVNFLKRRPASIDDLSLTVGIRKGDIAKLLNRMVSEGVISKVSDSGREFFTLKDKIKV